MTEKRRDEQVVPVVGADSMGAPMGVEPGMLGGEGMVAAPVQGSLALSVLGALGGAALGALVWFGVEYFLHFQIGYIAIGVGAAAGWGAVLLGKQTGGSVGAIAALAGVLGILAGSYGAFYASLHGEDARTEVRAMLQDYPEYAALPDDAARELMVDEAHAAIAAEVGYIDFLKEDTRYSLFMVLFGVFGLVYGFKIGAGGAA